MCSLISFYFLSLHKPVAHWRSHSATHHCQWNRVGKKYNREWGCVREGAVAGDLVVPFACRCECVHFVLIALGKQGEILIYMLIEMSLVFCSASVWFPSLLICLSGHIITTHRIRLPANVINFSYCPINGRHFGIICSGLSPTQSSLCSS